MEEGREGSRVVTISLFHYCALIARAIRHLQAVRVVNQGSRMCPWSGGKKQSSLYLPRYNILVSEGCQNQKELTVDSSEEEIPPPPTAATTGRPALARQNFFDKNSKLCRYLE